MLITILWSNLVIGQGHELTIGHSNENFVFKIKMTSFIYFLINLDEIRINIWLSFDLDIPVKISDNLKCHAYSCKFK